MKDVNTNKSRVLFGIISCAMMSLIIAALLFIPIPEENRSAIDILVGALTGAVITVFGYYFGSSDGSNQKNAVIANAMGKVQNSIDNIIPPFDDKEDYKQVSELYKKYDSGKQTTIHSNEDNSL